MEKEKRRHATTACDICRRQKIKCDCQTPCAHCKKLGKICIYSPRKKRGPPSRPYSIKEEGPDLEQKVDSMLSFVTNYFFKILLGQLNVLFRLDEAIPIEPTSIPEQMSNPKKLQLFAGLACSARCAGNFTLGERFFEHAKIIAKNFYDETENISQPLTVSLGFCLMALYSSFYGRQKAERYILNAQLFAHQIPLNANDPSINLRLFTEVIFHMMLPPTTFFALTFPLKNSPGSTNPSPSPSPSPIHSVAASPSPSPPSSMPPLPTFPGPEQIRLRRMTVSHAYLIPNFSNYSPTYQNAFIPVWDDGKLVPVSDNVPSPRSGALLPAFVFMEFLIYIRTVLAAHFPSVHRCLFEDILKEEFLQFDFFALPEEVAQVILERIDLSMQSPVAKLSFVGAILGYGLPGFIHFSFKRFEQASQCFEQMIDLLFLTEVRDFALFSPVYVLPPIAFLVLGASLQLGDLRNFKRLLPLFSHYAFVGMINARSGMEVLKKILERDFPEAQIDMTPQLLTPEMGGFNTTSFIKNFERKVTLVDGPASSRVSISKASVAILSSPVPDPSLPSFFISHLHSEVTPSGSFSPHQEPTYLSSPQDSEVSSTSLNDIFESIFNGREGSEEAEMQDAGFEEMEEGEEQHNMETFYSLFQPENQENLLNELEWILKDSR